MVPGIKAANKSRKYWPPITKEASPPLPSKSETKVHKYINISFPYSLKVTYGKFITIIKALQNRKRHHLCHQALCEMSIRSRAMLKQNQKQLMYILTGTFPQINEPVKNNFFSKSFSKSKIENSSIALRYVAG